MAAVSLRAFQFECLHERVWMLLYLWCLICVILLKFSEFFTVDVFSLEEDDGNELFITQEPKDLCVKEDKVDDQSDTFLGVDVMDFQSPC